MRKLKVYIVSHVLIPRGGASKDVGLIFRHLNRDLFEPHLMAGCDMTAFAREWDIPADRYVELNLADPAAVSEALRDTDIVIAMSASADTWNEYKWLWAAAPHLKLRVLRCIFGLGTATTDKADLFLVSSKDSYGQGSDCAGCHVVYPAVPRHEEDVPRDQFRRHMGIPEDAYVVGYASADQRREFFEVAANFKDRSEIVFLSALLKPQGWAVPPNVIYCGVLSQRQMASLYDASDVILHARTESFGYSVHQGIAAQKPIIAFWTDSRNAFAETMYPGGGYLARDVKGATSALEHVYKNRDEAAARARTALARVERLVPEAQVRRFETLMVRALEEKRALPGESLEAWRGSGHWPDAGEVAAWKHVSAEIQAHLRRVPFI